LTIKLLAASIKVYAILRNSNDEENIKKRERKNLLQTTEYIAYVVLF